MTDKRVVYEFHKRRAGDVLTLPDLVARRKYVSAFGRWKKPRPGTLKLTTRREGDEYIAEFSGIAPAETLAEDI